MGHGPDHWLISSNRISQIDPEPTICFRERRKLGCGRGEPRFVFPPTTCSMLDSISSPHIPAMAGLEHARGGATGVDESSSSIPTTTVTQHQPTCAMQRDHSAHADFASSRLRSVPDITLVTTTTMCPSPGPGTRPRGQGRRRDAHLQGRALS